METETDTSNGGESLTLDQAAAAYTKATETAVETDHAEPDAEAQGDDTTDDELQAEESAGEEDDGETAEDDQAEDDEAEELPDTTRVRLADGKFSTLGDLKAGSLRNADYTRKTQEVSEQRKAVEAQSERLTASEKRSEEMTAYNIALIKSIIPQGPPDLELLDTDPQAYLRQEREYQNWTQHLAYLEGQQTTAQKERATKATETERETADKEWATLIEKLPHLKDAKRVDPFVAEITKTAQSLGFTPAEMKQIALDHRYAMALYKAGKWDALQASKATVAKKVEGRPPVQKGGKRLNPSEVRARASTDAMSRLNQSGRLDDAVTAYLATQK